MTRLANPIDKVKTAYPGIMAEISRRTVAADLRLQYISANLKDPYIWVDCEVVVVQLRKICELILLGSTMAHALEGGIALNLKKWRPKDAFGQLERISDYPLPMPVTVEMEKNGIGAHHIVPSSRHIPFDVISHIYGICGDLLHVPTANQVLKGNLPSYDIGQLARWSAGFNEIVKSHILMLPEQKKILLCRWDGQMISLPEVFILEADDASLVELEKFPQFDLLP